MKLININIEGDKHFDTVVPFLQKERPDVLCLQEVYRKDLHHFTKLGYSTTFLPITRKEFQGRHEELGITLATHNASAVLNQIQSHYYHDPTGELHEFDTDHKNLTVNNEVLVGVFTVRGADFLIGTTHFTWIPDGSTPNDYQRDDMDRFLGYMKTLPPHCVTGDLNIPRHHNPLYDELMKYYDDAVPETFTSSLDQTAHHLANNPEKKHLFTDYMVDHLLVQQPYVAKDVRLEFGISDHAAVVATISKKVLE
jgi:exonuclease III